MESSPIVIIGMARSGTTLVANMLGSHTDTIVVSEPHLLWRTGNLCCLNDQEVVLNNNNINRIRRKLLSKTRKNKRLVEKSPINSLRAELVHSVFPDAKIIYLERDPIRLIFSNYTRSLKKDSFKLSIIVKKYFYKTGTKDLPNAMSSFNLFSQLSFKHIPCFLYYVVNMFILRDIYGVLPFGPKIKNFQEIIKKEGLIAYHIKVYQEAKQNKKKFKKLYGNNFHCFTMEDLMIDKRTVISLFKELELDCNDTYINQLMQSIDKTRVEKSVKCNNIDSFIKKEMKRLHV